ncbi:MAG: HAD family phosphatase [Saprospiraceae bacterium]|nr:HAD family phosphatase [Saprospiraceae bacterium]
MSESKSVRALVWDMGGVLVRNMELSIREQLSEPYGMSYMDLENLFFGNAVAAKASLGLAHEDDIWDFVRQKLNIQPQNLSEFIKLYWSCDKLDEDLYAFTMALRPRYQVALLSNAYWETRASLIRRFPRFFDMFDVTIFSAEVGLVKPDARIYRLTLEKLGVEPEEAVFVDDFIENIQGAQAVGMKAIHFKSSQQIQQALKEYFQ